MSYRSSHQICSLKKDVFKNIFKKEKEILEQGFSSEFCKIFKNIFFTKHLWTAGSDHMSLSESKMFSVILVTLCLVILLLNCSITCFKT